MEAASVNEGEEEFGSWRAEEEHGTKMMGQAEPYPQIRPGSLWNRPASQARQFEVFRTAGVFGAD